MSTLESVQHYYGKVLASTKDLKTSACCTAEAMPTHVRPLLADIHPEVQEKFYGCGSPIPSELEARIERKVGMVAFTSRTVRAFKLALEDRCEDYGQVAYYQGTLPEAPHGFRLDDHHHFKTGMPHLVCSNTAVMLASTRYAKHFKIVGDTSTHYGLFDCAPAAPNAPARGACC